MTAVKIILILMIALVLICGLLSLAWIFSPTEFTIKIQIDDKTLDTLNNLTEVIGNQSELKDFFNESFKEYSKKIKGDLK